MRRILSLVLLVAFGLPVVAPALTLGQDTESSLPACCRRHGVHHCNMQRPLSSAPAIAAHCPSFPQPSTAPSQLSSYALLSASRLAISARSSLLITRPTAPMRRISHEFALYKRGPPSRLL